MAGLGKQTFGFRRLHVDRKMAGILSVFTVLGIMLVVSIVIATNTLSALRGYATLQAHWTEARKEAFYQLENYIQTADPLYHGRFDSSLYIIHRAREVRAELFRSDTDREMVKELMLEIRTVPEDVNIMITTFKRFHTFPDFQEAVYQWVESDRLIDEMKQMAAEVQTVSGSNEYSGDRQNRLYRQAENLDRRLTESQYKLAESLASGTHFVNDLIFGISSSLGFILLAIGSVISFRFLKSIKRWHQAIEMSEQQYRSLFEQNPNAVYSADPDGRIVDGNASLEAMTGQSLEELRGLTFDHIIENNDREKVRSYFDNAAKGIPQAYETGGVRKDNRRINMEITNLPIYIDGKIAGVYGIIRDVTARKEAERQITKQLEEKTHLLAEIHDRVKNNMALISSLVQLQEETVESSEVVEHLNSIKSRIYSIAMVHERLYHTETFSSLRMDEYVGLLAEMVYKSFSKDAESYRIEVQAEPMTLSIKKAIPLGLLLNELLVNAFKYAFVNRQEGVVGVSLSRNRNNVELIVKDNGEGLPAHIDIDQPKTLGLKLVGVLSRQLNATLEVSKENGTRYSLRFTTKNQISETA